MRRFTVKFAIDLALWLVATPLAFYIRLGNPWLEYSREMVFVLLVGLPFKVLAIYALGLHRRSWHKVCVRDLSALIIGVGGVTACLFTVALFSLIGPGDLAIPRSVPFIEGMLALLAMSGARLCARTLSEQDGPRLAGHEARSVLVVGAGEAGTLIAREMLRHPEAGRCPIGFLDDDLSKRRQLFMGLRVLGGIDDLPEVVAEHPVDEVLIAVPSAGGRVVRRVVDLAHAAGVEYRIIPGVYELLSGAVSISQIREVKVEDLLRREPVRLELEGITGYLKDNVVLVTGAGGSIGSEIVRQVARFSPRALILLGRGENSIFHIEREVARAHPGLACVPVITDIRDWSSLERVFERFKPGTVFHAAAHKHVPLMETNPEQAIFNNVGGTRNLVELALRYGVERFVNVSTDKAVNPSSVMGASKRVAELLVYDASQRCRGRQAFVSVRFGNVLGSRGSVIPIFQEQIWRGGPVTVTHPDMKRYFMTIPEAAQLVLQAGSMADNGSVCVLNMGEPVRIADLACDLIRLHGLEPGRDVEICYTGIRPGEKLFEELLTAEEGTVASHHDNIFIACRDGLPEDPELDGLLTALFNAASCRDAEAIREALCRLVPTHHFYAVPG